MKTYNKPVTDLLPFSQWWIERPRKSSGVDGTDDTAVCTATGWPVAVKALLSVNVWVCMPAVWNRLVCSFSLLSQCFKCGRQWLQVELHARGAVVSKECWLNNQE